MAKKKDKVKIPQSVRELRKSPKKFAKRHNIRLKGKGFSKSDKKRALKHLEKAYSEMAINGLNKAVKILADNPNGGKKIDKVREGVENIITMPNIMRKVAKLYKKNPDAYPNMIYLPNMIMNTLQYYSREDLSEEEKAAAETLDKEALVEFSEKILKKQIKRYKEHGLSDTQAFQMASVIPTTKLFKNRQWYRRLIVEMYNIAAIDRVDVDKTLKAICKVDKKNGIKKKDFLEGFFSEFILTKNSNKTLSFNDNQKELHETLIDRALAYMDNLKHSKLRDMLKKYIKRRKNAESYKNDTKRVIKFVDHAHSNSSYVRIKEVVTELIADNTANELYLG